MQLRSLNRQLLLYQLEQVARCVRNNFNILFRQNYPVPSPAVADLPESQRCSLPYHRVLRMPDFRWRLDKLKNSSVQEISWAANIWQLSLFTFVFFSVFTLLPRCLLLAVARLWTLRSWASPCIFSKAVFTQTQGEAEERTEHSR